MKQVLVIGGKLQGLEIVYLSGKAGYRTIVVDRKSEVPARGLATGFVKADIMDRELLIPLFRESDIVFPAIEDIDVLERLMEYQEETGTPVVFDMHCYRISSSKTLSNQIFEKLSQPLPEKYPNCGFPVIIKPDSLSGSNGVHRAETLEEAEAILSSVEGSMVVQEYLEGRSFSLEVLGDGEKAVCPMITEILVDQHHDCKRVIAPARINPDTVKKFQRIAEILMGYLKIKGIFDIEVIQHRDKLKILEIDARFPSQTPISIYHASGFNMVKYLANVAMGEKPEQDTPWNKVCCYQQIEFHNQTLYVLGEHIMGDCCELTINTGFFGADEAITDYQKGSSNWKAIIITTGETQEAAMEKFHVFVDNLRKEPEMEKLLLVEG